MITAIGTDIVELNKIRFHFQKKYFLDRVFTKKERDYANGKIEHLATLNWVQLYINLFSSFYRENKNKIL